MKKQSLASGAIILAGAGFMVKVFGALFKIPLGGILSPVGMASFSIAYNIYALLFVISTAGIPAAVSKMIAEAEESIRFKILKTVLPTMSISGAVLSAVLFFCSGFFARIMGSEDATLAICAIAPAVFFVSVSAPLRGYFQGHRNMSVTAISELIEALGKLVLGLGCATLLARAGYGVHILSAGAVLGVTGGAALSAAFLMLKRKNALASKVTLQDRRDILKTLFATAVPITLGASVVSLSNVIDSALIMRLLHSESAMWLFGSYNLAATVFNLPGVVITGIGTSLLPAIAEKNEHLSETIEATLKITAVLSFSAALSLFALGEPVMNLLYGSQIEMRAITYSGRMLSYLAIAIAPLGFSVVSASVLQGLGNVKSPMYSMMLGAICKVLLNVILIPRIGIFGACVSTIFSYVIIAVKNAIAISKNRQLHINYFKIFFAPLICALLTGSCARGIMNMLSFVFSPKISVILAIFGGVFVCLISAMVLRVVTKYDKKLLFGQKSITKF